MTEWDRNWLAGYMDATRFYVLNECQIKPRDLPAGCRGSILIGKNSTQMANPRDAGWSDACLDAFGC